VRFGVHRVLMLGAVLSAASNLLFAWLAGHGHDVPALIAVVSADNLSGGIASAAFIAYLSGLTNVQYSATQYALFSSMMLLAPKWLAGFSGVAVDAVGYATFFSGTAVLGVPVLALIWVVSMKKLPLQCMICMNSLLFICTGIAFLYTADTRDWLCHTTLAHQSAS
jgi:PAT family beta-lactamase induction signal transducer AmpG